MCEQCVVMLEEAQLAPSLLWAARPNRHKVLTTRPVCILVLLDTVLLKFLFP